MSGQNNSKRAPTTRNNTPQSSTPQDAPLSPVLNVPSPSSSLGSKDIQSDDTRDQQTTTLADTSPGIVATEEKTVPSFPLQTTLATTEVAHAETSDKPPQQLTNIFGSEDVLMKVFPSSELVERAPDVVTSSSPVDGPSRSSESLHAHFQRNPSAESSRSTFVGINERDVFVFPQRSHTKTPFSTSPNNNETTSASASQPKPRPAEAAEAPTTHTVRSTTIPTTLHPQPPHPEEVFSEPNPFSQIYPPRQRCDSRSCAMRRSAFNAMSCNILEDMSSPSPTSDSEPSSPTPFPTEPVLVEMNSDDQTSSTQSDYFQNASYWNDLSTLPATTTPSGQSDISQDILSCFASSDLPLSSTCHKLGDQAPLNITPQQDPRTKHDPLLDQSLSEEKVLALLSPMILDDDSSTSDIPDLEEIARMNQDIYLPSSSTESKDEHTSGMRFQDRNSKQDTAKDTKKNEGPGEEQRDVITKNGSPIKPNPEQNRKTEAVPILPDGRDSSRILSTTDPDVNNSRKLTSSLMPNVPPTLNQNEDSKPQPSSEGRSSSQSSNVQISTEYTDSDQAGTEQPPIRRSNSRDKNSKNGSHQVPKPQR